MKPQRIARLALAAFLSISLVGGLAACQRSADVDVDGDSVTITGPEGEEVEVQGGNGSLPEGWPEDFPVYEPSEIQSSTRTTVDEGTQLSVSLTTTDAFDDVIAWYKQSASAEGWTVDEEGVVDVGGGRSGFLLTVKGETQGNITITEGDEGTLTVMMIVLAP
jgi:hypothetical protein